MVSKLYTFECCSHLFFCKVAFKKNFHMFYTNELVLGTQVVAAGTRVIHCSVFFRRLRRMSIHLSRWKFHCYLLTYIRQACDTYTCIFFVTCVSSYLINLAIIALPDAIAAVPPHATVQFDRVAGVHNYLFVVEDERRVCTPSSWKEKARVTLLINYRYYMDTQHCHFKWACNLIGTRSPRGWFKSFMSQSSCYET